MAAPVKKPATGGRKPGTAGKAATSSVGASRPTAKATPAKVFDGTVFGFARDGDMMYAATSAGILKSGTGGTSWTLANNPDGQEWYFVSAAKSLVFAANLRGAVLSSDGGQTWTSVGPPAELTQAAAVAVDGFGGLWIGGREGVYHSEDKGATWHSVTNLYVRDVNSLFYDERGERILVTGNSSTTFVFSAHLPDKKVSYWNTGWNLRLVRPMGNHLVGATLFDGVVIQPEMVNSVDSSGH
jgi:ligand-binding sensor domain-containing protein